MGRVWQTNGVLCMVLSLVHLPMASATTCFVRPCLSKYSSAVVELECRLSESMIPDLTPDTVIDRMEIRRRGFNVRDNMTQDDHLITVRASVPHVHLPPKSYTNSRTFYNVTYAELCTSDCSFPPFCVHFTIPGARSKLIRQWDVMYNEFICAVVTANKTSQEQLVTFEFGVTMDVNPTSPILLPRTKRNQGFTVTVIESFEMFVHLIVPWRYVRCQREGRLSRLILDSRGVQVQRPRTIVRFLDPKQTTIYDSYGVLLAENVTSIYHDYYKLIGGGTYYSMIVHVKRELPCPRQCQVGGRCTCHFVYYFGLKGCREDPTREGSFESAQRYCVSEWTVTFDDFVGTGDSFWRTSKCDATEAIMGRIRHSDAVFTGKCGRDPPQSVENKSHEWPQHQ
ncbi:hypothetical protein BaRGS_00008265 [Batillaria attramentaria]|uniref:Uncharacterized protein n=1 Tax=Batillaria attramentaria TaxID=370345 RepID=A0ABD0LMX5_9CAEN